MIRRFHTSVNCLKNPYYFYDLQRMQGPQVSYREEDSTLGSTKRTWDPLATQSNETMQQRVRRVFGDLGSREESRKEALAKGITVAGIHVPARPEEPTNCCMSGCVNCVWELYKDEIDEYRTLRKEARKRLSQPKYNHVKWPVQLGPEPASRREDYKKAHKEIDETVEEEEEEDVDDLNTGIKTFIETEKKIRARKQHRLQESAS